MPEGDTIFNLATRLQKVLLGDHTLARAYSAVVEVDEHLVRGATVLDVTSRGKHLLVALSTGYTLHCHLGMYGRVKVIPRRPEDPPRKPFGETRLILGTEEVDVIFHQTLTLRLVRSDRVSRSEPLRRLGPDPLREELDVPAVAARMLADHASIEIANALLDQRVLTGVGNVFKSEILFCAGADPFAPVSLFTEAMLEGILDISIRFLRANVDPRIARASLRHGRITRITDTSLRGRGARLWVYERVGKPCLICGSLIRVERQGLGQRSTFFCRSCQPKRETSDAPLVPPPVDAAP